ncbi:MAG: Gfo/Idh/MocA family oxidoreductase [Armatimonadota bacterium]|nr:Gfo/Idh/MocA family oxidoreductase [Armatimonadota bacterium]
MSVKVGIIGCGSICEFHLRGYEKADAEIVYVADANETRAKARAAAYDCQWATDYHKLLQDPRMDCVSICLPNHLHREAAEAAIAAGKHVLCEKTMTSNLEDAKALVAAVEAGNSIFQIAYMKRFVPAMQKAKELVPKLGKILSGTVRVYHPFPTANWDRVGGDIWLLNKEKGGAGVMVHSGSHMLDAMRFLCGDPLSVEAKCFFRKGLDYYDTAYFQMEAGHTVFFESGWLDLLSLGVRNNGWDERIELTGEKGRLEVFTMWWTRPDSEVPFVRFYSGEDGETRDIYPPVKDCFVEEVAAFVDSVKQGKQGEPDVYDGYMAQAMIDAAYRSDEEGRRMPIERLARK